ncbi:hypothetical protein [Chondrinema litorale]|uniref:hypothetical protein n=1 Tax=Chondrinema litorale TaxID=2994555 RepID=UPI00254318CB|nr:hypothetical protein [Chondrinema litorale]UZR95976.1 hypothetical protein OQ292_09145 [Chondrinema litorale]
MGFRLIPIFIKSKALKSDEEILKMVGLPNLEKGKTFDFYDTNKQWDSVFIGTKDICKILCNGELASKAFKDENPFLNFEDTEIASIIWDETSSVYGFSLIKNGKTIRKVLVSDGEFEYDYGEPIPEELEINEDEIFIPEEKEEIIEGEGEEAFQEMMKAEKVCRVADTLAKRYIGAGVVGIQERIELNEYE